MENLLSPVLRQEDAPAHDIARERRALLVEIERFSMLEKMRPSSRLSHMCAIVGGRDVTVIAREVVAMAAAFARSAGREPVDRLPRCPAVSPENSV